MVSDGEIQALGVEVADLSGFRLRESVLGRTCCARGEGVVQAWLWWSVVAVRVD